MYFLQKRALCCNEDNHYVLSEEQSRVLPLTGASNFLVVKIMDERCKRQDWVYLLS